VVKLKNLRNCGIHSSSTTSRTEKRAKKLAVSNSTMNRKKPFADERTRDFTKKQEINLYIWHFEFTRPISDYYLFLARSFTREERARSRDEVQMQRGDCIASHLEFSGGITWNKATVGIIAPCVLVRAQACLINEQIKCRDSHIRHDRVIRGIIN